MKRISIIAAVCILTIVNIASAKITINGPTKSTRLSRCPAKDGMNQLSPYPPEYVAPPDAKSPTQKELANGDTDFTGWTFKKGPALSGTLTIDYYHSKFKSTHYSGSQIRARYNKGAGDPATLRWVQLVDTSAPKSGASSPYIDPYPEDEPNSIKPDPSKTRPFYYNEEQIADRTAKPTFDLKFYDYPKRYHPPDSFVKWEGTLFLSSWDGNTPGTVSLHDGIKYGFIAGCWQWGTFSGFRYYYKFCNETGRSLFTPYTTDKVVLTYTGSGGTISNVMCDQPGVISTDGDTIEINWDPPLEPNTPVGIDFMSEAAFVAFDSGQWSFEGAPVGDVNNNNSSLERIAPAVGLCNAEIDITGNVIAPHHGTAYQGQWHPYPFTNVWTAWFDDGPFEEPGQKKINTEMIIERLDPGQPAFLNVRLGYATAEWELTAIPEPPLPMFIPDPATENLYIFRDPVPIYNGPVTDPIEIDGFLESLAYNPKWTSISVQGENINIRMAMINHDDPYLDPLGGADTDGDNAVGLTDLELMSSDWLSEGSKFESDLNGDEIVDLQDFAIFAAHFGQSE